MTEFHLADGDFYRRVRRLGRQGHFRAGQLRRASATGLAFSEFSGYEDWQLVAISQTEDAMAAILANPTMIDAYRASIPPATVTIPQWNPRSPKIRGNRRSAEASAPTSYNSVHNINFMEKDSRILGHRRIGIH